MKKIIVMMMLVLALLICLSGCSKYDESYISVMMITSEYDDHSSLEFGQFTGTKVFKMKNDGNCVLSCDANISKGKMKVYCDYDGKKQELFTLGDDEVNVKKDFDIEGSTVYIIIESDGECENGSLKFELR